MLTQITVKDFKGTPYLETSKLMKHHNGKITFSLTKPNVLVGENGGGKSALVSTLALRFLAYQTGKSSFDDEYLRDSARGHGHNEELWWTSEHKWRDEFDWLKGLNCETDNAPVLYYKPGHIPGNHCDLTHALMMGYSKQANAFAALVDNKSSGQQSQAVLAHIVSALAGEGLPEQYGFENWSHGKQARDLRGLNYVGSYERKAELLKMMYQPAPGAVPLILMDEPEQSLDARAECQLWVSIAKADCSKMQLVVATHSLYPLLHQDKFNIIEATPGFADEVLQLMA